jgi:uncharacterized membrane protein
LLISCLSVRCNVRYTLYKFFFTLTHYYLTCYILLYFYYHIIIITIIIVIINIIVIIIIIISVFCTVRYTLYESATEYGKFAYCLRSIWRHHSDKKYAKLIRSALLQLCLSVRNSYNHLIYHYYDYDDYDDYYYN